MKCFKDIEFIAKVLTENGIVEIEERDYNKLLEKIKDIPQKINYQITEYISSVSNGQGQIEISEEEYNRIHTFIRNQPKAEQGFRYRLKADLTREKYELPIVKEGEET